jgi:hypothetical protein
MPLRGLVAVPQGHERIESIGSAAEATWRAARAPSLVDDGRGRPSARTRRGGANASSGSERSMHEGGARGEGGEAEERGRAIACGAAVRARRGGSSAGAERRGEWTRRGGGTARGRRRSKGVERPSSGRELHSQTARLPFNAHFPRCFFT